jgi:hypothetical protein
MLISCKYKYAFLQYHSQNFKEALRLFAIAIDFSISSNFVDSECFEPVATCCKVCNELQLCLDFVKLDQKHCGETEKNMELLETVERLIIKQKQGNKVVKQVDMEDDDWGVDTDLEPTENQYKNLLDEKLKEQEGNPLVDSIFSPIHQFFGPWTEKMEQKPVVSPVFYQLRERVNFVDWIGKLGQNDSETPIVLQTGSELISSLRYLDKF